jgi:hypothetical protein
VAHVPGCALCRGQESAFSSHQEDQPKTAITAGMKQLRAEQRAFRLAEMRRRLGIGSACARRTLGIF